MKKENGKNILITVLIIIVIFLIILIVLLSSGRLNFKNSDNNTKQENNEQQINNNVLEQQQNEFTQEELEQIANDLMKKYDLNTGSGSLSGYFFKQDTLINNNISDEVKIYLAIRNMQKTENNDSTIVTYDYSDVSNKIHELFGEDVSFTPLSLKDAINQGTGVSHCRYTSINYNATKNIFEQDLLYTHCTISTSYYSKIVDVTQNNNKINVTLKVAYMVDKIEDPNDYYIDDSQSQFLTNDIEDLENYLDQMNSFQFTFVSNSNNNYYLYSIQKIS